MARYVFLDSGPLGLASNARGKPDPDRCRDWLQALETTGVRVVIPEIVDYEVRRELIRVGATAGIIRLDRLLARFPLLTLDRPALLQAAKLWVDVRRAGLPTAHPLSLDGDAIPAGQVLAAIGHPDVAIVATRNIGHLARFPGIDARSWDTITCDDKTCASLFISRCLPLARARLQKKEKSQKKCERICLRSCGTPLPPWPKRSVAFPETTVPRA